MAAFSLESRCAAVMPSSSAAASRAVVARVGASPPRAGTRRRRADARAGRERAPTRSVSATRRTSASCQLRRLNQLLGQHRVREPGGQAVRRQERSRRRDMLDDASVRFVRAPQRAREHLARVVRDADDALQLVDGGRDEVAGLSFDPARKPIAREDRGSEARVDTARRVGDAVSAGPLVTQAERRCGRGVGMRSSSATAAASHNA